MEDEIMHDEQKNKNDSTGYKVQTLFGDAFQIKKFPQTMRDISDLIPINDNQEVFSDVNESNPAYSGNQLIIEILAKVAKNSSEAIYFIF